MNNEIQAGATAENSTNVEANNVKPLLAQNPMLAAVLIRRDYPCICCSCPTCDAVFMAAALKEEYHNDNDANKELLNDLAKYASQGYNISVRNSTDFKLDYCSHLKK